MRTPLLKDSGGASSQSTQYFAYAKLSQVQRKTPHTHTNPPPPQQTRNPDEVLPGRSGNCVGPQKMPNATPHNFGHSAVKEKMLQSLVLMAEVTFRITRPRPLNHVIFGKDNIEKKLP